MKEIKAAFVRVSRRVPGVLYEPAFPSGKKDINVLVMHSDEDYLSFPTGPELAGRGYTVLCANVMNKEGILYSQNTKMHCVRDAVNWLRERNGGKVILMGHSGGGTLMSAYQALAENGPEVFAGPEKFYPYRRNEHLPAADGIMLLDSNWGNAVMQLFSLDPAVTSETNGVKLDPSLDLFNEQNGFRKEGSVFSDAFISKYQTAQGQRNNRILDAALERLELLDHGKGDYSDDEPLIIPGAAQSFFCNKLFPQDIRLMSHTQEAYPLIHADGSVTTEVIRSVRKPDCPDSMTHSFWEGARFLSIRTYLSGYAVRTEEDFGYDEDHVWGVDWDSSYCNPVGNMKHVHVPTLIMGMTAGWEFLASETIYKAAGAADKTIAFVEGANHKFETARHCEEVPGQFGDTMKTLHDYLDVWLSSGRF
ncbi:MAG: alpha/beta hydrolase [Lachnospiraceae bacterium]|nr:alpha/beta hydrolase [Lachnospiraceae bacterium]